MGVDEVYDEMTNADFVCLLHDAVKSGDGRDLVLILHESARRIRKLESQAMKWESAAQAASGVETFDDLQHFLFNQESS